MLDSTILKLKHGNSRSVPYLQSFFKLLVEIMLFSSKHSVDPEVGSSGWHADCHYVLFDHSK